MYMRAVHIVAKLNEPHVLGAAEFGPTRCAPPVHMRPPTPYSGLFCDSNSDTYLFSITHAVLMYILVNDRECAKDIRPGSCDGNLGVRFDDAILNAVLVPHRKLCIPQAMSSTLLSNRVLPDTLRQAIKPGYQDGNGDMDSQATSEGAVDTEAAFWSRRGNAVFRVESTTELMSQSAFISHASCFQPLEVAIRYLFRRTSEDQKTHQTMLKVESEVGEIHKPMISQHSCCRLSALNFSTLLPILAVFAPVAMFRFHYEPQGECCIRICDYVLP
ncbi:hypothetical protein EDC04DRAFT_2604744 [Pisolithus marmoratus]|nr:hypothetical protein EDC04DRAFT_2604744 [Pisolithus marmoratus]